MLPTVLTSLFAQPGPVPVLSLHIALCAIMALALVAVCLKPCVSLHEKHRRVSVFAGLTGLAAISLGVAVWAFEPAGVGAPFLVDMASIAPLVR